ncbi:unnamed protein product, partial [Polarella glacialis]
MNQARKKDQIGPLLRRRRPAARLQSSLLVAAAVAAFTSVYGRGSSASAAEAVRVSASPPRVAGLRPDRGSEEISRRGLAAALSAVVGVAAGSEEPAEVMLMSTAEPAPVAPSSEFLQLRPIFKLSLLGLGLTVVAELVAGYVAPAATDLVTVLFGVVLLRRDVAGLLQGLIPFLLVAVTNALCQLFTLLQLLQATPGPESFFKEECMVSVTTTHGGQTSHESVNFCSWQTVLGNSALLAALALEFLCARSAFRMVKSMHNDFAEDAPE